MVRYKKIILACCAVQKIAHQLLATLRVLENAQVKHGQSELKILVSVVRFRPRPPFKSLQHRGRASLYGVVVCAGAGRSVLGSDCHASPTLLPTPKSLVARQVRLNLTLRRVAVT
jgi:hypothetical protein